MNFLLRSPFVGKVVLATGLLVGTVPGNLVFAQDSAAVSPFQKDEIDKAIDNAIQFLLSQQRDDGSIADRGHETAMTSLAIMAMASVGTQATESGPRGECLKKALDYVLREDRADKNGYFGKQDNSRMYGHGITTLMLTEMIGMGADEKQDQLIQERCEKAIDVILSSQKVSKDRANRGGWRYSPDARDSDLSVSVWQLMALRSAKNDGLEVPVTAIEEAVDYLRRSYSERLNANGEPSDKPNGFTYTPESNHATFTMTAAGLLALQVCGHYESPLVKNAANWLLANPPKYRERFFFYGTYYYAQGMYQRDGEHAKTAEKLVREALLPNQDSNGSWNAQNGEESSHGRVYSTALAVLSLSVKYHYLPIYQR